MKTSAWIDTLRSSLFGWTIRGHKQTPHRNRYRPSLELMEARLAPANLVLTNAFLVNSNNAAMPSPDKGEMVYIQADWTTQGLPSNASYRVSYAIDGVTLSTNYFSFGAGSSGTGSWNWYLGGWFASPGSHSVTVTVDPDLSVAETTYADNTQTFNFTPVTAPDLPQKFITPLGGTAQQSWGIVNYVDANPLGSSYTDFNGGDYTYDGHTGHDMTLANFSSMDAGVPDYAAAAGTIIAVQDGNYDRNTVGTGAPANYITINHGNGWQTIYYHLRTDSILVHVGDQVVQGQILGLAGSSGNSTAAHLHFEVHHNGDVVEPEYDPTTYWVSSLPYQASVRSVGDSGITSSEGYASADLNAEERPVAGNIFSQASGQQITLWFQVFTTNGDTISYQFYEPDGTHYTPFDNSYGAGEARGGYWYWYNTLPTNAPLGTWHVAVNINGTQYAYDSFQVTASGAGAARVVQGNTYVSNGRTTPVDFGTVAQNSASPQLAFTVQNIGSAALNVSNLVLPSGFSLVGSFPSTIAAGNSATFTVQMITAATLGYAGIASFSTNDPNTPTYAFDIKGAVSGGNTGAVHGQIFHDINDDAIENGSDAGISGWTVSLLNPVTNNVIATAPTGFNGLYAFLNLAAGTYRVRETPPSGWFQSTPNPADVTVAGNDVLASPFGASVQATTTTTLTDNGPNPSTSGQAVSFTATVSGGSPISGQTVFIEDADASNAVVASPTLTGGAVTFTISNLTVGTHHLFAVYNGDTTHAGSNSSLTPVTQVVNGSDVAPVVSSVVVNGGAAAYTDSQGYSFSLVGQNSVVEQVLVTFSEPVTLAPGAFSIINNAAGVTVYSGLAPNTLAVNAVWGAPVAGSNNTQWIVTFSGPGTTPLAYGGVGSVIKDGLYKLHINAAAVTALAGGLPMASDSDTGFWAMYGAVHDNTLSGTIGDGNSEVFVDANDFNEFKTDFNSGADSSLPTYDPAMDYDLDGFYDADTFNAFKNNFNNDWVF